MNRAPRRPGNQTGASYIEVLAAVVLLGVALVPMMDAMHAASMSAEQQELHVAEQYRLSAKLEEVLAEPFPALASAAAAAGSETTPTSYSDPGGTANQRLVYLSLYDADNADADDDPFTGTDAGLIWVRVEISGSVLAIESLVAQ